MIKAVIFDFDGVLVDSHGTINQLFTKIANEKLGLNITEKDFGRFPGIRFEERIRLLAKEKGIHLSDKKILETREEGINEYRTNSSSFIKLFPGVRKLLEELKDYKIGLGSNGSRKTIDKLMEKLDIKKYFDNIVTYDDVTHGKPAPEMFLKNAEFFHVDTSECVVIEDSVEGVTAAKAAGMKVIALLTTTAKEYLEEADLIVKSINDLNEKIIRGLGREKP